MAFIRFCKSGIIPAYAGNANRPAFRLRGVRDHPRVCGERRNLMSSSRKKQGSSPRMRGTHSCPELSAPPAGIIPAYAGNAHWLPLLSWLVRDHPRVCGERQTGQPCTNVYLGSSPRMRGTLAVCASWYRRHGIIPAYAGNAGWRRGCARAGWDHPRVCGERCAPVRCSMRWGGSSPRMRGTLILG